MSLEHALQLHFYTSIIVHKKMLQSFWRFVHPHHQKHLPSTSMPAVSMDMWFFITANPMLLSKWLDPICVPRLASLLWIEAKTMQLASQPMQTLQQWDIFVVLFLFDIVWMIPETYLKKTGETEKHLRRSRRWIFGDSAPWTLQCSARRCAAFAQKWLPKKKQKKVSQHMEVTEIGESNPDKNSRFSWILPMILRTFRMRKPSNGITIASLDGHKILPFWGPRALAPALLLGDGEVGLTKGISKKYWYCDNGWWKKSGCNQLRWYK